MSKSQRPLQSLFQQIGMCLLSSRVSAIQILQNNCSQEQSSSQLNALLLGPSKGAWGQSSIFTSINLKATQEGSEPPAQLLVWFLFDLCRNYAHMKANLSVAVKKKKKIKLAQATNLQLPPTPWKMADELPPPQPSWPINKTAQKAAEKRRWLLTYLPLC